MSRPYPGYDDGSPLSPSGGSLQTPISYSANVNRQKTKKWVEAKAPDYGGDDWGDEYSDEVTEAPPPPEPTGLRQPSQAAAPDSSSEAVKKSYGDLPAPPAEAEPGSATMAMRPRVNSFGEDDERRAFSSGHTTQSALGPKVFSQVPAPSTATTQPPVLQLSTQHPSVTGLRKKPPPQAPLIDTYASQPLAREDSQLTTSSRYTNLAMETSNQSQASDIQTRRDLSPAAVPPPQHSRYSPAPQSAVSETPSTRFPPRKSSMSSNPPDLADITRASQELQKPWVAPRSSSPSGSTRSPVSEKKVLPFIRPADIYKRLEEERERERQSMDSSRPSMDSTAGKAGDRSVSPAKGAFQTVRSDSPSATFRKGPESDNDHVSESGRRQMLEPVRERKSEYGLYEFRAPPETATTTGTASQLAHPEPRYSEDNSDDERRRYSTSPKIPEIGRMSGFGMDMFAQRQADIGRTVPEIGATEANDVHLRTRSSLGFASVVHQTFDKDIPDTPPSASGSGVGRNESETTGTTGVSPILGGNSSVVINQGVDAHQSSVTPAVEEVEEPESRQASVPTVSSPNPTKAQAQKADVSDDDELPPAIHPGHRRNISTPSPGNSPARTPHVELGPRNGYHSGEEAHISDTTGPALSPSPILSQGPRPVAEREQSFRPQLPGGWTSYATITSDDNTPRGNDAHAEVVAVSPISEGDGELEITPITTNAVLPQSADGAAAGYALEQASKPERGRPPTPVESAGIRNIPPVVQSNRQLPIPDPALAPTGSIYSTPTLDPRIEANGQSSRLDAPRRSSGDVSSTLSAPPTPPPKDTRNDEAHVSSAETEYLPRYQPPKSKVQDELTAAAALAPQMRPQTPPTINADTNDNLRKFMAESLSLSPRASVASAEQSLAPPTEDPVAGTRESTYLPSEYDSYWDEPGQRDSQLTGRGTSITSRLGQDQPSIPDNEKVPPIPPLSAKRQSMENRPPNLGSSRFSWEAGSEQQVTSPVPAPLNISRPGTGQGTTAGSPLRHEEEGREAYLEHGLVRPSAETPAADVSVARPAEAAIDTSSSQQGYDSVSELSSAHTGYDKESAFMTGGLVAGAVAGAAYVRHQTYNNEPQRRLSLAEENSTLNSATYAVTQTPPNDEHPSLSPQVLVSPVSAGSKPPSIRPAHSTVPVTHPVVGPKILQFKEILGLQNQDLRIKAYNDTRGQFLDMDTGLSSWLSSIDEQHRHLGEPTANFGNQAKPTFPKSTGSSPASPALQQPYYQQYLNASPTTSRPPTAGHSPAGGFPGGSQSQLGFSPGPGSGGNKLASQSKSKELLHTAGVFGGKAGKVGKGLFAKGKNKLKEARGGDKDKDSPPLKPSPKPKSKDGRRSSWGISSLTLSRPTRNDASSQHSREQTLSRPPHSRQSSDRSVGFLHNRTPSMPLQLEPLRSPPVNGRDFPSQESQIQQEVSLWDAPISAMSTPNLRHSVPAQPLDKGAFQLQSRKTPNRSGSGYANDNGEVLGDEEAHTGEELDTLGVPAPIGKHQPSWDPFNATPITEEEGFQYDGSTAARSDSVTPAVAGLGAVVAALSVSKQHRPLDSAPSHPASERSNSGETAYLSAQERHSEATERPGVGEDWVHVMDEEGAQSGISVTSCIPTIVAGVYVDDVASPGSQLGREAEMSTVTARAQSPPAAAANIAPREAVVEVQEIETPSGEFPTQRGHPIREKFVPTTAALSQLRDAQYAPPRGLPSQVNNQSPASVEEYVSSPGPPPRHSTRLAEDSQSQPAAQTSKPIFEQTKAERYSSSPAFSPLITAEPRPPLYGPVTREQPASFTTPQSTYPSAANQQQESAPQDSSQPGFIGLPPIRRTSTFGLGFGKKDRPRFPIDDDDEVPPVPSGGVTAAGFQQASGSGDNYRYSWVEESREDLHRPGVVHQSSSDYEQFTVNYVAPVATNLDVRAQQGLYVTPAPESQEGWRPNASNQRSSAEVQRVRTGSGSTQGYMITPGTAGVLMNNHKPTSYQQAPKSFEQPPSSAQRYPDLFRPEQLGKDFGSAYGGDMPAHHYQAPLSREEAFLPRHQTNEYQLPGVGPPEDPPNGRTSRRNSGLFKELGGRLSRELSRTRGGIRDQDVLDDEDLDLNMRTSGRILESRNTDVSVPSIASVDTVGEKKKRRSSIFGAISRASTGGGPPSRGDSTLVNAPGSRTDLLDGVTPAQPSPLGPTDKKRSFFGGGGGMKTPESYKTAPNKLTRASTATGSETSGKKKRFSGLSSLFGGGRPTVEQEGTRPSSSTVVKDSLQGRAQKQQAYQVHDQGRSPGGPPTQSPPGGPDPRGRQFLHTQMPQGQPVVGQIPYLPIRQVSPGPPGGLITQPPPFQFTQDPNNLQRQGTPRAPLSIQAVAVIPSDFGEKPTSQQLQAQQENRPVSEPLGQRPIQAPHSVQSVARPIPPFTQGAQMSRSPVQSQNFPGIHSPNQKSPPTHSQHESSHFPLPLSQGPQDSLIYQRQPFVGSPISQQPQYEPVVHSKPQNPFAHDARQNHGGQPALPYVQSQISPAQRQTSDEQVSRHLSPSPQNAGLSRRSGSAQRKLTRSSPPGKAKAKEKEKTGVSSASRLFGGILGKRASSDKLNKHIEPRRSMAAGPQNPQLWTGQAFDGPQQYRPQQPSREVSQGQQYQQQAIPQNYENQQDRGRQLQREPQYEQPPIPMGYNLVRGEGSMLAPTNYNPRGVAQYGGPQQQDSRMYQQQHYFPQGQMPLPSKQQQQYQPQAQGQQYQGPLQQSITQHPNLDAHGQHQSQSPPDDRPRVGRPLSSEDLLARSPARPQFGQQAPYQLTLPEPDHESDTEEETFPQPPPQSSKNVTAATRQRLSAENVRTPALSPERNFATAGLINTSANGNTSGVKMRQPSLRHPMSPATYPLPENTLFSPINPSAQGIPPPPPPKNWPQIQNGRRMQTLEPQQELDRSNTINTHGSEISQLSGPGHDSLGVPSTREKAKKGMVEEEQGSPQITPQGTPERSPEKMSRLMSSTSQSVTAQSQSEEEEDIYDASPHPRTAAKPALPPQTLMQPPPASRIDTSVGARVVTEGSRPVTSSAQEKQLAESPDQRARRRAEQEEKILVDDGHPAAAGEGGLSVGEEERATMSATSYPGQEWNPYGNYESWDD